MKIKNITDSELMSIFGGTICKCFQEDMHTDKKIKMINMSDPSEKKCMEKCCIEAKYLEYKFASQRTRLCPRETRLNMKSESEGFSILIPTPFGFFIMDL